MQIHEVLDANSLNVVSWARSKLRRLYTLVLIIAQLSLAQYISRAFRDIKLNLIQLNSIWVLEVI